MTDNNLVTIATPSYNSSKFISETINSVLAQTYKNWEMIVVDDCSTDNSRDIAASFVDIDSRIRLIKSEEKGGPAAARNIGISEAKGRYVAFLDSDDLWLPEKLSLQVKFMQANKCTISYTAYKKIDEEGNVISNIIHVPERATYSTLLSTNCIACLTAMYDSEVLGKVYLPEVGHEDYALWLRILKMGHEAYGLNECLALYRVRSNSVSGNKLKAA